MTTAKRASLGVIAVLGLLALVTLLRNRADTGSPETELPPDARSTRSGGERIQVEDGMPFRQPVRSSSSSRLLGTVQAPDGQPVANAAILAYPPGNWREQDPVGSASSDGTGRFEIPIPGDGGGTFLLHTEAEGFLSMTVDPVSPDHPVEITLRWLTEIWGTVRDRETGEPIAEASVSASGNTVLSAGDGSYRITGIAVGNTVLSAGDGSYRISGIVVGIEVAVTARKEPWVESEEWVLISEPRPLELDLFLRPGTPVSIEVFDRESDAPIEGARIRLMRREVVARTDQRGRFTLRLAEGQYLLVDVEADGYCPLSWRWQVENPESISPRIPLARWAFIEGRVTDEAGLPVSGVAIDDRGNSGARRPLDGNEQELPGRAVYDFLRRPGSDTDAEGRFRLAVAPGPSPFYLVASRRGYVSAREGPLLVTSSATPAWLDIVLRRGAAVRGHVLRNGEPWKGDVWWRSEVDNAGGHGEIGPDGAYELRDVSSGEVQLYLRADLSGEQSRHTDLVLEAGETYEHDFEWAEERGEISGTVTNPDGTPLVRVLVSASTPDGRVFRTGTRSDGTYRLEVEAGQSYEVSARRPPVTTSASDVAPGSTDVDFVLAEPGVLRLSLVDAVTLEPIPANKASDWSLAWKQTGDDAFEWLPNPLDSEGRGTLELPVVGSIDLSLNFTDLGYSPQEVSGIPVTDVEGPAPLTIALERGLETSLRVRGDLPFSPDIRRGHLVFLLEGSQLADVRGPYQRQGGPSNIRINGVNMWLREPGLMKQLLDFDDAGATRLRGLAPGTYYLRVFPGDFIFEPDVFQVSEDGAPLEVRWTRR